MTDRPQFRILGLTTLLACFGLAAPAAAQMAGPAGLGRSLGPIDGGKGMRARQQPQEIAPPALPGASGAGNISAGPVANTDQDPTKLLFEAINHGDYAQARAAVSRGANLEARNALNETPIELAVELNRNQITFMLLSARAEERQPVVAGNRPGGFTAVAPGTGPARGGKHEAAVRTKPAHTTVRPAKPRSPAPASPVYDDPGQPDPAVGFLGFGGNG